MSKKGKIILAVSVSTVTLFVVSASVGVMVCKKIYEKKYFSVD